MENNYSIKIEQKKFIYKTSFYISVIFIICLGYILSYIPNELNKEFILSTYNIDIKYFVVENSEKAQYILCTITFPLIFILCYLVIKYCINSYEFKVNLSKINESMDLLNIILIFILLIVSNFYESFYIYGYFKGISINNYILSSFIVFIALYLFIIKFILVLVKNDNILTYNNYYKISIQLFIILLIIYVSYFFITKSYFIFKPVVAHHFDAYFYPVYKVFSGQTPLIDFRSLYGFYPYFIEPILKNFSSVNMYWFSVFMAFLLGISLLSISITLYNLCEDKIFAILGVLSIIYIWVVFPSIPSDTGIYYLQYVPHRIISPVILLLICMIYIKTKNILTKKIIYYLGYLFVAIALLWNIDTGVVAAVTYVIFHIYNSAYLYKLNNSKLYLKSFYAIFMGILSVIFAILILVLITYIRTTKIINFSDIFYGQNIFYNSGFYMENMPLFHPWLLLITIYLVSLTKALRNIAFIRDSEPSYNEFISSFYFIVSVLGIGLFSYYQGRSKSSVFIAVIWPSIILLVMLGQEYLNRLRKRNFRLKSKTQKDMNYILTFSKFIIVISSLIVLSIGSIMNIFDSNKLSEIKNKASDIGWISDTINFIESIRNDNEPLDLIMNNSAAVYSIMEEKMTVNAPASVDWFTKDDYKQVLSYIQKTNNLIVFDLESYNLLLRYNSIQLENIIYEKNCNIDIYKYLDKTYIVLK